ncbi:unnamed protein product [Meganyctiphanes norvegica]|uniref:DNA polymerase eta n=1 Tax=Meganyctiphanes norvegica TaxID=48144 RepID=A0AAV2Q087_MEGNR
MTDRIVVLLDMDCFYVQVEERDNPNIRGEPAAVVQYNTWKGGGLIATNYEARAKGVEENMLSEEAQVICPDMKLIQVPVKRGKADHTKYRLAAKEVIDVLSEFSECVERASIDEAYSDFTEAVETQLKILAGKDVTYDLLKNTWVVGYDQGEGEEARENGVQEWLIYDTCPEYDLEEPSLSSDNQPIDASHPHHDKLRLAVAALLCENIRAEVLARTGFKCSVGISHNKMLAKLACDLHKPNQQTVLPKESVAQLWEKLPVHKIRYLDGKLGVSLVDKFGCRNMGDLSRLTLAQLKGCFDDKTALWLHGFGCGICPEAVTPRELPKSIGCGKSFQGNKALGTKEKLWQEMRSLCDELCERLEEDKEANKRRAKTINVKIHLDNDVGVFSKQCPLPYYLPERICSLALSLIQHTNSAHDHQWVPSIKNISLSAGNFENVKESKSRNTQNEFKKAASLASTEKKSVNTENELKKAASNANTGSRSENTQENSKNIESPASTESRSANIQEKLKQAAFLASTKNRSERTQDTLKNTANAQDNFKNILLPANTESRSANTQENVKNAASSASNTSSTQKPNFNKSSNFGEDLNSTLNSSIYTTLEITKGYISEKAPLKSILKKKTLCQEPFITLPVKDIGNELSKTDLILGGGNLTKAVLYNQTKEEKSKTTKQLEQNTNTYNEIGYVSEEDCDSIANYIEKFSTPENDLQNNDKYQCNVIVGEESEDKPNLVVSHFKDETSSVFFIDGYDYLPPLDYYMNVDSSAHEYNFVKNIRRGDILFGKVIDKRENFHILLILATDSGRYGNLMNTQIKATLRMDDTTVEELNKEGIKLMSELYGISLISHTSLMNSLRGSFPEQEMCETLRTAQIARWAYKNVADGVAYYKNGFIDEAFQSFNRALKIDEENVEAHVAKGALLANLGKYEKAVEDFESALKFDPRHKKAKTYICETLVELGRILEGVGKLEDAESKFKKCLKLVPEHEKAKKALHNLYRKVEQITEPSTEIMQNGLKYLIEQEEQLRKKQMIVNIDIMNGQPSTTNQKSITDIQGKCAFSSPLVPALPPPPSVKAVAVKTEHDQDYNMRVEEFLKQNICGNILLHDKSNGNGSTEISRKNYGHENEEKSRKSRKRRRETRKRSKTCRSSSESSSSSTDSSSRSKYK